MASTPPGEQKSTGRVSQRHTLLTWYDLEESCHRLDEAQIRIESLDLSCMEEEDGGEEDPEPTQGQEAPALQAMPRSTGQHRQIPQPPVRSSNPPSLLFVGSILLPGFWSMSQPLTPPPSSASAIPPMSTLPLPPLTIEQAVAFLGKTTDPENFMEASEAQQHDSGTQLANQRVWSQDPLPICGADAPPLKRTVADQSSTGQCNASTSAGALRFNSRHRPVQQSVSSISGTSWASTLQSQSSTSSDAEVLSPVLKLKHEPLVPELSRAGSRRLHRLAVPSSTCWEEGGSRGSSSADAQGGVRCGTPHGTHAGTPHGTPIFTSGSEVGKPTLESGEFSDPSWENEDLLWRNAGNGMLQSKSTSYLQQGTKPSRKEAAQSSRAGRLVKNSTFPQYQEEGKDDKDWGIPSILAPRDPTWDLWEGEGDFCVKETSVRKPIGEQESGQSGKLHRVGMKKLLSMFVKGKLQLKKPC